MPGFFLRVRKTGKHLVLGLHEIVINSTILSFAKNGYTKLANKLHIIGVNSVFFFVEKLVGFLKVFYLSSEIES